VDDAVLAAKRALDGPWAKLTPKDRSRLLWEIGNRIRKDIKRLTLVETLDTGKPFNDAKVTVERTADYFCYYAGIVDKLEGTTVPLGPSKLCFTERVPIGVTGHIVPWNVPISMLACGNTAVVKPAEETPLSAILLVELLEDTGIPAGVVNVIPGFGKEAGRALSEHPEVRHITFTGSIPTGKAVMAAAATHLASVTLELGGKSPHVVLRDADLDVAIPSILTGMYKNAGQICSAGTRLLVDRPIHEEVVDRLVKGAESISLGHGLDNPAMGPLISDQQLASVVGFAQRARDRGVTFATGGDKAQVTECEGGYFFTPSIADNVPPDDELGTAEVFGPILSVIGVDDVDHAIDVANGTSYGLAAGIQTQDISKAMRFARGVEAGQVFINGYHSAGDTVPFGGMKESGIGREKGLAALDAYCEIKAVTVTF
jgi:acyl-CoA reductase-like NAD-dependent aldehyde dehydrogenase